MYTLRLQRILKQVWGPFLEGPEKPVFTSGKPQQNLKPYDHRVLFTYS